MIMSRTPFRVSLFGGGTDYPVWYREHGGSVLVTTINKYCYISCRWLPPFFAYASRIVWSVIELVNDPAEIRHPAIREILRFLDIQQGIDLHHNADLPARTGLGSSSSFTVGLLNALYGMKGIMRSKLQLAQDAIHVEQERLRENVGSQDQVIAAFGGLNRIDFAPDDTFRVTPVILGEKRLSFLQDHLMLFFTGFSRYASDIAAEQIKVTNQRISELQQMQQLVDEAMRIFHEEGDISVIGQLLHEGWELKKSLTDKVSSPEIDAMYEAALRAGAIGGKLLGAGGGGFLLLFVKPEDQTAVREALKDLLYVPFQFENHGSRVIFYEPDGAMDFPSKTSRPFSRVNA